VKSQDLIKEIQILTLANDSLKRAYILLNETLTGKLQVANDSISRLISNHKSELSDINKLIRKLERDTADLNKLVKKLDKNNLTRLELQLKEKSDSLLIFSNTIINLNHDLERQEQLFVKRENQKFAEGRQNALSQLLGFYRDPSFSKLLLYATPGSVQRDLLIADAYESEKAVLKTLQIFFDSRKIIENPYNSQSASDAIKQMNSIPQVEEVVKLKEKIEKYGLRTDGLKSTLNKIVELDKKYIANDDYTQRVKFLDILAELSWYFRNYRFEFGQYPFLSDIIVDVMKRKEIDANADIRDLLSKL
jgi:hypothetical protein